MDGLNVAVLGTRGFPGVQGGVEKHSQELYPRLAARGVKVTVFGRRGYVAQEPYAYRGVEVVPLATLKRKHQEALLHTLYGLAHLRRTRPRLRLVHLHAIGPALLTPLARWWGFKVVATHHGPDYERQKWGSLAKGSLRLGEALMSRYAHGVISVSRHIQRQLKEKYGRESAYLPNGVTVPRLIPSGEALRRFGLTPKGYILAVGRFVPEKGFHDLAAAYREVAGGLRLVIAGDADHEDAYSRAFKAQAARDPRVVLTGFISGRTLAEVYSNARFFVLPSYHEGLPIALLEALSYGLPALVSRIPANTEIIAEPDWTFPPGEVQELGRRLSEWAARPLDPKWPRQIRARLRREYDWDLIAAGTLAVYRQVMAS